MQADQLFLIYFKLYQYDQLSELDFMELCFNRLH